MTAPGTRTPVDPSPRWLWLAFAWGLAEAVFFFIVPDVLTTRLVLQRARTGFLACLTSLAGALLGGLLLFELSKGNALLFSMMDCVPGISPTLIEQARLGLEERGLLALFAGAVGGIPYKLYAVQASSAASANLAMFLLVSAGARFGRFMFATGLAWLVGATLRSLAISTRLRLHAIVWFVFYVFYFLRMGF